MTFKSEVYADEDVLISLENDLPSDVFNFDEVLSVYYDYKERNEGGRASDGCPASFSNDYVKKMSSIDSESISNVYRNNEDKRRDYWDASSFDNETCVEPIIERCTSVHYRRVDAPLDSPVVYDMNYVDYPETLLLSREEKKDRIKTEMVLDIPEIDYYHSDWYCFSFLIIVV